MTTMMYLAGAKVRTWDRWRQIDISNWYIRKTCVTSSATWNPKLFRSLWNFFDESDVSTCFHSFLNSKHFQNSQQNYFPSFNVNVFSSYLNIWHERELMVELKCSIVLKTNKCQRFLFWFSFQPGSSIIIKIFNVKIGLNYRWKAPQLCRSHVYYTYSYLLYNQNLL